MLKHPDPEVQLLVEMLEGQRDSAMAQAAALFRQTKELEKRIAELAGDTNAADQVNDPKSNGQEHQS